MSVTATSVRDRSEIPAHYTWNAPSVFLTLQDWESACDQFQTGLAKLDAFKGRLHEGSTVLADAIDTSSDLLTRIGHIYVYAGMSAAVEMTNQQAQAMEGRAMGLFGRFMATNSFIDPELIAIGKSTLKQWLSKEPRLAFMDAYIDNLFRLQEHVRSAEVEEVLGMTMDAFGSYSNAYTMLTDADMRFGKYTSSKGDAVELVQSNMEDTKHNPDREARRTAWEQYADEYLAHKNTLAATLIGSVKVDVFNARARRYQTALEASLFQNNIPPAVYHNLINTFKTNLPTWHKYWRVRRRALGVEELWPYDIWAPLTSSKPRVTYEEAVDWISAGMAPLGADYVETLRRGCLEDRWVDVYPNQGKRQGAFSSGWKGTHPFIMMSYSDDLESMSTLAHELGHSMHSYQTNRAQPQMYSNYSMFAAETASNFNQAMVRAHLLSQNADPAFQIGIIQEAMSNFHRYFFIMPTLARFELDVHTRVENGQTPTADDMIALMAELFSEGYGGEMHVDLEREGITWAQFPHLYAGFYVFNYATGIAAAHSLSRRILSGTSGAAESYLKALSMGNSMYPVDTLKLAGADMLTPEPVEQTFAILAEMVDRLDQLIP